ncbi:MAG: fused MFS/spermidine synthase, partial [Halobacteriales archaeon]|nr:fused MFS/spermidine synthase [Halobacteriales archaeon]
MQWPSRDSPAPIPFPEVAVFVSGVSSMGLEILAGRIVAPQYGSSIFTWGSIIGVFLLALSVGYIHGGRQAAERATVKRIAWLLIVPAAYIALIVFAHDRLVAATGGLGLPNRYASLPAVVLLFGPPTYFLGFISPYAAELSEATGRQIDFIDVPHDAFVDGLANSGAPRDVVWMLDYLFSTVLDGRNAH